MRLLLFNPETEYALASGAFFYTPPSRVERMRRERQLLPEVWAKPDDFILVDNPEELTSTFKLVSWEDLESLFKLYPTMEVEPWGWNAALVRRLKDAGVPDDRLPDNDMVTLIRRLAHRRTTVTLNTLWNSKEKNSLPADVPVELTSVGECHAFYNSNPGCWMKAPWSSSGRGVINTAADMTPVMVEQWCRGIIRRQGSVMGETGAKRIADFASEWRMSEGQACFQGLSTFSTSNRGKYISNEAMTQESMLSRFNSISSIPVEKVISLQSEILQDVLKGYEGPCGVDMIVEKDGRLRPFVELNLRRTMGMLYL